MKSLKLIAALAVGIVLLAACQGAAPADADVPSTPASAAQVPRIEAQELRKLLAQGANVTLIDTRSADQYEEGHIRGAIHIPAAEIEARRDEIPALSQVVLYCA